MVGFCSEAIDEGKSIASDLCDADDPAPDGGLHIPRHEAPGEAVEASVFVGEGSADPCLDVAHVPHEVLAHCFTSAAKLLGRMA